MVRPLIRRALPLVFGILFLAAPASAQMVKQLDSYDGVAVRILQSNNAGNIHHIIDPATNEVTGLIKGCPHAHNLTTHPDSLYYYCANESEYTLDVFDTVTLELVKQIKLSARPNKVAVNKKHRKAYVAIAQSSTAVVGPGFPNPNGPATVLDVIDVDTNEVIKSIPVHSRLHNTYMTPNEDFVVVGNAYGGGGINPGEPALQVIDPVTDEVVWGMELTGHTQYGRSNHVVRPMAFEANEDGSMKRIFGQGTGINAIFVADWETRKVTQMLFPPPLPPWEQNADGTQSGEMHGLEVLPDRSAIWASSRLDSRIYGWTLPDLEYIGSVKIGPTANWMTPTPDSRYMYVAVSGADYTLAVDLQELKVVAKIKTGARPARISTAILPLDRVNTSRSGE